RRRPDRRQPVVADADDQERAAPDRAAGQERQPRPGAARVAGPGLLGNLHGDAFTAPGRSTKGRALGRADQNRKRAPRRAAAQAPEKPAARTAPASPTTSARVRPASSSRKGWNARPARSASDPAR